MKYFIPEWNDRVDPRYDFISDTHSPEHEQEPTKNDVYMWEIFGPDKVPFDGLLISRITIEEDRRKYAQARFEGIHKALRLPQNFEILGDCGAFGYVNEKKPPFDPVRILDYYKELGFNYGVSVDHLVVPQFKNHKEERMKITYENGVKAYKEWSKRYIDDFQLVVAIQGWDISDYIKMYKNYVGMGASHLAFGGLSRSLTPFIAKLIDELLVEISHSKKMPTYLHFFGLARTALFPRFQELENLGVRVGFDSASYLRKAWLSAPMSQLNYLNPEGKGYTAIRIPFTNKLRAQRAKKLPAGFALPRLKNLEQESLKTLRLYDGNEASIDEVMLVLFRFNKAIGESPELLPFYRRTLEDKPWKSCGCPICRQAGIEVVIFRGNNRNRRRGFHNTYVFHSVFKNPKLWAAFMNWREKKPGTELSSLKKGDNVLVVTECSKRKLGYRINVRTTAQEMYQGRLFKCVRRYCQAMGFNYVIISAKYGLLLPNDIIGGYEKILSNEQDVLDIQPAVEKKLGELLKEHDKIVVIAGEKYRKALHNLWDDRFTIIRSKGYGDLCNIIEKATPPEAGLLKYIP
ncbi:MAG: tRNA-guanine transglycosylase DpdA [Candidatus Bathyarchaeia archaeon]